MSVSSAWGGGGNTRTGRVNASVCRRREAGLTLRLKRVWQVLGTNSLKGKVKSILSVSPHAAR